MFAVSNAACGSGRRSVDLLSKMTEGFRLFRKARSTEVSICRNQDAILFCGAFEDRKVIVRRHAIISNVRRIMPGFAQTFRQQGR